MLTLSPGARVFVAIERVDGRKGIDGLSVLVRSQFGENPLCGTLYVFFSRRADRVRVLYWDRDGYELNTELMARLASKSRKRPPGEKLHRLQLELPLLLQAASNDGAPVVGAPPLRPRKKRGPKIQHLHG